MDNNLKQWKKVKSNGQVNDIIHLNIISQRTFIEMTINKAPQPKNQIELCTTSISQISIVQIWNTIAWTINIHKILLQQNSWEKSSVKKLADISHFLADREIFWEMLCTATKTDILKLVYIGIWHCVKISTESQTLILLNHFQIIQKNACFTLMHMFYNQLWASIHT